MAKKVPGWAWALLLGAVMLLPRLSGLSLWDPYETGAAEGSALVGWVTRVLPPSPLAARLPFAIVGILGVLAAWYAGAGLFSRRAGLLAALALVTCPLYVLEGRSAVGDVVAVAGLTLAVGGFGRWALRGRWWDLALGAVGASVSGVLSGVAPALFAPLAATALGQLEKAPADPPSWRRIATGMGAAVLAGAVAWRLSGGLPAFGSSDATFADAIRNVGFGFFPASAVVPVALGASLVQRERRRWADAYALSFAALAFIAYCVQVQSKEPRTFAGLGALALVVGAFLDEALESKEAQVPLGIAVAGGMLLMARGLALNPERFAAAHVLTAVDWPMGLRVRALLWVAAVIAVAIGVGLAWPRLRRALFAAAGLGAVVLASYDAQVISPVLSEQLSLTRLASGQGSFASFHGAGHGLAFVVGQPVPDLPTAEALDERLRSKDCAAAFVPASELAALDDRHVPYFVLRPPHRGFALVSGCLPPGEADQNPLRRYVRTEAPPEPPVKVLADFEGKAELYGVDMPRKVAVRDGKFRIALYFRVKDKMPPDQKIFVHAQGCGARVGGDHLPVEGLWPTQRWAPGQYVTDVYEVSTAGAVDCGYQLYAGLSRSGKRMKLAPGSAAEPNGSNRVPLGSIVFE